MLDIERTLVSMGIHHAVEISGAQSGRVHLALMGAVDELDTSARRIVGDVARTVRGAVDGLAGVLNEQVVGRIDATFNGDAVRSIERVTLPAAEVIRSASVLLSGLSDDVLEAIRRVVAGPAASP